MFTVKLLIMMNNLDMFNNSLNRDKNNLNKCNYAEDCPYYNANASKCQNLNTDEQCVQIQSNMLSLYQLLN